MQKKCQKKIQKNNKQKQVLGWFLGFSILGSQVSRFLGSQEPGSWVVSRLFYVSRFLGCVWVLGFQVSRLFLSFRFFQVFLGFPGFEILGSWVSRFQLPCLEKYYTSTIEKSEKPNTYLDLEKNLRKILGKTKVQGKSQKKVKNKNT